MPDAIATLSVHYHAIRSAAKNFGVRPTARAAGVTPMLVSRFISGSGGLDARTLYQIAWALGWRLTIARTADHVPSEPSTAKRRP